MIFLGRILVVAAISLLFLAYSNFAPTALSSPEIADYVKNHFVREMLFGVTLSAWAIILALSPLSNRRIVMLGFIGSIVVLPFWIASLFGWSTDGLQSVWGEDLRPNSAYFLHGPQLGLFYVGMALISLGFGRTERD